MKKEIWVAVIIGLIVLIFNSLPLIIPVLAKKDGLVFLGRRFINSQDIYPYLSLVEQSKQGRILMDSLYTSDIRQPRLLRPSYFLVGKLAAILNIPSILSFHFFRIVLSVIFLIVLYKFLSLFFDNYRHRILSFAMLLTSSGLGYALGNWIPQSADLWIPEAITFLSLAEAPHFILSQILMLLGYIFFLKAVTDNRFKFYIVSSLLFFPLAFEHPFNLVVVGLTHILMLLWLKRNFWGFSCSLTIMSLGLIYQVYEMKTHPLVIGPWASQSTLSPDLLSLISGYGLIIVFALIGAEKLSRQLNTKRAFLFAWTVSTFILLYAPFGFQRRFIEGLHIPLTIMAVEGVLLLASFIPKYLNPYFIPKFNHFIARSFIISCAVILSISSIWSIFKDINILGQDSKDNYYYYLLKEEIKAMDWLKERTSFQDVVLANWFYGNILPGVTGRKVYVGHKIETPNFDLKVGNINRFLVSDDAKESVRFLKENNITYIFLGKNDSMLRFGFKPDQKPYLENIYSGKGVSVFKVL